MNATTEDQAFVAWMDEQAEQAGIAERLEQERYEAWRDARLEDGYAAEESTVDDYEAHLEDLAGV